MNKLSVDRRCQVVAALVEGNSIRATARMTGVSKPTILKLIAALGPVCAAYQNDALRDLGCRRLECDEIWQFVYAKAKNVESAKRAPREAGDVWTWVAIDAESKLIPTWRIGPRDAITAHAFMLDLAGRLKHRVQITTDGLQVYIEAVEDAFGMDVDYAQMIKVYGADSESERRYSPSFMELVNIFEKERLSEAATTAAPDGRALETVTTIDFERTAEEALPRNEAAP